MLAPSAAVRARRRRGAQELIQVKAADNEMWKVLPVSEVLRSDEVAVGALRFIVRVDNTGGVVCRRDDSNTHDGGAIRSNRLSSHANTHTLGFFFK